MLGFSSFSILLPQALCTIAAVGLLYATVRRSFGPVAGLIAGAALAVTPVTVAIGRVNNPDALLVLLMVGAAALLMRAVESGRTKHLAWCGALVGLAFMTKMLQGWMIVPALGAVYLLAGPPRLLVRVRQLAVAGLAMVAVSAAWPLAVTLWPGSTPYIGGSTDGSVWDLILGYNGFGRLTGAEDGMGGGASFGGSTGVWRMFNEQVGGQIAWLLPLAGVSLVAGLWLTRSLNGNNVIAGPATSTGAMGGMPGGGGGAPAARTSGGAAPAARTSGGARGGGGEIGSDVIAYLTANQGSAKYLLAASGSQTTASIIIATGKPVVTIGGFSGNDPAPTVTQLAAMVANGELKYVLISSGSAGGPGGGTSNALTTWVKAHGTAVKAVTVSSGTLYKVSA